MVIARRTIVKKPANPNPRPKRPGPFRGPTPEKVIQTLDVGTGKHERFGEKANKNPQREYVGIDPRYGNRKLFIGPAKNNSIQGINLIDFIRKCIEEDIKIRNVNFDMPDPKKNSYDFKTFFDNLDKVLLPNGKVFMNSEELVFMKQVARIAQDFGFSIRIKEIPLKEILKRSNGTLNGIELSEYMLHYFTKRLSFGDFLYRLFVNKNYLKVLYQLEITYPLTKAFPNKEQRRNWPRT